MFQPWTSACLKAELDALQASADRAGAALACIYSSSEEFETATIRARRSRGLFDRRRTAQMRLVLAATAGAAVLALAVLAF